MFIYTARFSPIPNFDPIASQKHMERFAVDHEGFVAMYAETLFTEEEHKKMFDNWGWTDRYQKLRKELSCEKAFPTAYEKISRLGRSMH